MSEEKTEIGLKTRARAGLSFITIPTANFILSMLAISLSAGTFYSNVLKKVDDLRLVVDGTVQLSGTHNSVTWPFLSILVSWTALLFFGFGLLARLNAAAVFTLAIGALSVASAIFLILELDAPYSGILRLPPTPILEAIDALGK